MIIENGKIDPKVHNLLHGMLNPEKYGNSVTPEVRDEVRALLGMSRVEQALYATNLKNIKIDQAAEAALHGVW